jgi:hypothetical protein
MTYFTKKGKPTSRIDLAYASANMGQARAATATQPAGISATHAALGFSFFNPSHNTPEQDFSTAKARDEHVDHAVGFMTTCGGRCWTNGEKNHEILHEIHRSTS